MKYKQICICSLAILLSIFFATCGFAMEAPGRGDPRWSYSQKSYQWFYTDPDGSYHKGWLFYEGEWYWFDDFGAMKNDGLYHIDGISYYFYGNGQMAYDQYIGLQYIGQDGQRKPDQDIRVIGTETPTAEDRDMITDALYLVPRGWLAQFEQDGWQLMFYKKKSYFAAPDTDLGIYYVHHSVDYRYKKVKFTDTDALLQAVGEYVGYRAGCYEPGDTRMEKLWAEQITLNGVLNIPDYYSSDMKFYFGSLFSSYLDAQEGEEIRRISPAASEIMEEILHEKDADPSYYQRMKEEEAKRLESQKQQAEALGGPGVSKPIKEE